MVSHLSSPKLLPYILLDVFCLSPSKPFTGNPLAVVFDGYDLSDDQMLTMTREFNLSETVFPFPPTDAQKEQGISYSTRIWSIMKEYPFAGHPSLGSCFSMIHRGVIQPNATTAVQHCKYGLVEMQITPPTSVDKGYAIALSSPISFVFPKDKIAFFEGFSKHIADEFNITAAPLSVHTASCGLPFLYIQLPKDQDVLNARQSKSGVTTLCDKMIALHKSAGEELRPHALVVFWVGEKDTDGSLKVHQRVFTSGLGEDPATGSASIALGLVLHSLDLCGKNTITSASIAQGAEVGHPSAIKTRVVDDNGKCVKLWVEGEVALVAEGTIRVPGV